MTSKLRICIRRYIIVRNCIESENIKRQPTNDTNVLRKSLIS